jgi:mannose-6-phosphate isomerase-like protein (cupin superfamily)
MNKTRLLAIGAAAFAAAALTYAQQQRAALGSAAYDWRALAVKETASGCTRPFFHGSTAQLQELACHATTLKPGLDPHPPHQHPEEELYVIQEGTVDVLISGQHRQLGAGSVVFAAANEPHGIRNAGSTPATYLVIKWRGAAAAAASPAPQEKP